MNTDDKTFDEKLKQLGDLYEEGKGCLHQIVCLDGSKEYFRLFDILREMRDLAALQMKEIHTPNNN